MESPLALYRRYRPETFAEVIGQDHVTEPLRAALANNRVNHAYLFSGPRGCGKTTSARILARALNCEQAPVADPCGECRSCRDLARGGPGSIDVIEIDAASHGGVDDARDLREKAFFAPVASKYKVYIIDEAHMVTPQGFNALLKLVEEPPPHLRFIFATTEPDKVLPTIRSRTHHYPFRLIPPRLLSSYLSELCEKEGVPIEPAALPLVVRAGGGSARDTLSVLDQLMGGSGPDGVTHRLATGLLGYTPDALLDEVVEAFAAGDGGAVFGVVDKVIETGQDPRRFAEDLLRRLRDLVIVAAVPDAPASGLIDVSEDQGERLVAQAARYGGVELSRAADLVATGLTEMRGATAPRLLLELVCARVLLPGADHSTDGLLARLDRLERRVAISGAPATVNPQVAPAPPVVSAAGDTVTGPPTGRPDGEGAAAGPADGAPLAVDGPGPPGATAGAEGVVWRRGVVGRAGRRALGPLDTHEQPSPGRRAGRRAEPGRRTPALARHRRGDQAPSTGRVDAPDAELPGRLGGGQRAHPRVQQRRRPRVLPQRGMRRGAASGRHRRRRRRLDDRDAGRPRRAVRDARGPGARAAGADPRRTGVTACRAARGRPRHSRRPARGPSRLGRRRARPADRPGRRRRRPARRSSRPVSPDRPRPGRPVPPPGATTSPIRTTPMPTPTASTPPSCSGASSAPRSSTRSRTRDRGPGTLEPRPCPPGPPTSPPVRMTP